LFWKVTLAPNLTFCPQEKEPPVTSSSFSVARPANPTANIFKFAGNVKILSPGKRKPVRASVKTISARFKNLCDSGSLRLCVKKLFRLKPERPDVHSGAPNEKKHGGGVPKRLSFPGIVPDSLKIFIPGHTPSQFLHPLNF
jgi:hypothetical protein